MPRTIRHTLSSISVLRNLAAADRIDLETRCTWRSLQAPATIVHHQEPSTDVYFLVEGRARVIIYSPAGRAVAYRDLLPGQIFGEYAALDGKPRSAAVEAIEDCLVAVLKAKDFRDLLVAQSSVSLALLEAAVAQFRSLTERVYEFSALAVANRIHAEVLRLALAGEVSGNTARIVRAPTHFEIANRVATTREAVTRELNRMENLGVIRRVGNQEMVCALDALRRLVDEAAGA